MPVRDKLLLSWNTRGVRPSCDCLMSLSRPLCSIRIVHFSSPSLRIWTLTILCLQRAACLLENEIATKKREAIQNYKQSQKRRVKRKVKSKEVIEKVEVRTTE